jgi:hypothetical protein
LDPDRPSDEIEAEASHRREVDDDASVAGRVASDVVRPAANRHQELVLAGELDGPNDVDDSRAARDQRRTLVDGPVPHLAGTLVSLVRGEHELPSKRDSERLER